MSKNCMSIGEAYYTKMGKKDIEGMKSYLHPDVLFVAPLATHSGKEAVLEAAKNFIAFFKTLTIRAKFGSADQAMIVYDLECPAPIGTFAAAVLMTFQGNLISKFELIFDARLFEKK